LRVIYAQKVTTRIQRQQRNFLQEVCCTVEMKLSGMGTEVFRFWVVKRISSSSVITPLLSIPPTTINVAVNLLTLILIPTGGRRFSSLTLETMLEAHPDIFEAAVVGVVDEEWGERPKAYVTAKSGAHIDGKEVIEWMKHNGISHFMVPREVEVVGGLLPRTSSGKPKKNVLKEWAKGGEKRME
jgi:acyl-CoA synthetase (AMP-forming)/AMP-acid ligase II